MLFALGPVLFSRPLGSSLTNMGGGGHALQITIVTDRLSEEGRRLYVDMAAKYAVPIAFVDSRGMGNGPSFQTQIDVALKDSNDTLALILEDDYLISSETLLVAYDAFCRCSHLVGLNPHFHPGCVCRQNVRRFCVVGGRVYGRVNNTCCTFFMPIEAMRRNERALRRYDGWEKGSINQIWKRGLCLVPFGWTMAEHLHKQDLSPVFKKKRIDAGQESP